MWEKAFNFCVTNMNAVCHRSWKLLTDLDSALFQVTDHHDFTRDGEEQRAEIRAGREGGGPLKINPLLRLFPTVDSKLQAAIAALHQHSLNITPRAYAIGCCFLKRPKLSNDWPFQSLAFIRFFFFLIMALPPVSVSGRLISCWFGCCWVHWTWSVCGVFFSPEAGGRPAVLDGPRPLPRPGSTASLRWKRPHRAKVFLQARGKCQLRLLLTSPTHKCSQLW